MPITVQLILLSAIGLQAFITFSPVGGLTNSSFIVYFMNERYRVALKAKSHNKKSYDTIVEDYFYWFDSEITRVQGLQKFNCKVQVEGY